MKPRPRRLVSTRRAARGITAIAVALTTCLPPAYAAAKPERAAWTADLTAPSGTYEHGVAHDDRAITLAEHAPAPASVQKARRAGEYTLPPHRVGEQVNRVAAKVDAQTPRRTAVTVEVRGRLSGGPWTEWRAASDRAPAALPAVADQVQVRLTLLADRGAPAPRVSRIALTADRTAAVASPRIQAVTSTVFATREGLVGGTTANGHVIKPRDHFVALPSRRGLNPNDQTRDYQVKVCYPKNGRCETAPVWDVGPWNTRDDYWNPSDIRENWKDLPQGKPEAQAAYQNGYNGGLDQFGRRVLNPAGIDLADGTFWDGLGMGDNDWVEVTYLWTDGNPGPGKRYVDTFANAPGYSSPGGTRTGTLNAGTNYVYCRQWGPEVRQGDQFNHWWMRTDLDSGNPWQNQWVSAYYLKRWGNDEAKDNSGQDLPNC